MNPLIACCGLDCEACDARIATITNDNALREKTAALWSKLNGVTITPDMMKCTGCRAEGAKTPFCDSLCPIHNCVREKRLETCADCAQMDGCPTLERITANTPSALENLKRLRSSEQAGDEAAEAAAGRCSGFYNWSKDLQMKILLLNGSPKKRKAIPCTLPARFWTA